MYGLDHLGGLTTVSIELYVVHRQERVMHSLNVSALSGKWVINARGEGTCT